MNCKLSLFASMVVFFVSMNTFAAGVQMVKDGGQWTCDSSSFPHQFEVKIYNENGRFFGQLYEAVYSSETYETHDGDLHHKLLGVADDLVELELAQNDAAGLTFKQKEGPVVGFELNVQPTWKSHEVIIKILTGKGHYKVGERGLIEAKSGPLAAPAADHKLNCW